MYGGVENLQLVRSRLGLYQQNPYIKAPFNAVLATALENVFCVPFYVWNKESLR